jgi:hypothetical protein
MTARTYMAKGASNPGSNDKKKKSDEKKDKKKKTY